jgi:hypothetical protein
MEEMVPAFSPMEVCPPYYMKEQRDSSIDNMSPTKSLNDKKLRAKPMTKSPSMVDEKLHSHHLEL